MVHASRARFIWLDPSESLSQNTIMSQLQYPKEPIAIVGSACRFAGGANSPNALWELLKYPRDVLSAIPPTRFNTTKFYHPDGLHSGTSNVQHSYLLDEDHRLFDAAFFGVKSVEATAIDPQQRILLEIAYEALEAAGIPMEGVRGSNTGVYVGLMVEEYSKILGVDILNIPDYFASGTARNNISNRISYFFDLNGPSMTIDTACSSSLVALHQAVLSLRAGEIDGALVAGANLILAPEQYVVSSKLRMLSPSGRSRMWDAKADGYGRGDGLGVLVLKNLSRAIADGDDVECIIRETGVNQDGRTKGLMMPNPKAQVDLIRNTYKKAGLSLENPQDRPQFFECKFGVLLIHPVILSVRVYPLKHA
ncbi:putative acyl transferase acyl hydrolase lysophospholipase [Rosellinia necatrix]|uniref:Putative acyl transferase acyl hydrolase lysophospholipase n=1 Tax=Rosellinia necatrix TaxID=77044 RepID=A0A1S8A5H6_ROSNE|nr:putative acyl transferase acyl hydrolase lysophospholipase [Rosellinia necatrix]